MSRAIFVGDHGCEVELEVLGLQIGGETVADAVLFARGYLDVVASRRQVTDDLGWLAAIGCGPEASSDEFHAHGLGLLV